MNLLVILVLAASQLHMISASEGFGWKEGNCSSALHVPLALDKYSQNQKYKVDKCPPWFYYNELNGTCSFSQTLQGRVSYVKNTLQTAVLQCYCMTEDRLTREPIIGACPYTCLVTNGYYTLPCNASTVENFTCGRYNRRGVSCGECAPGYGPPVYSYSAHCTNCTQTHYVWNWIKYLAIAFGPLTLFTVLVIVFQIRATSPYLFSYIFFVQTMTISEQMRLLQMLLEDGKIDTDTLTKWGISLISFWNLDFFRLHYAPFCLQPTITTLQANFMDFFVALYPLILIALLALVVELRTRCLYFCKIIFRPVSRVFSYFGIEWNMRSNLISAFATFVLLSNEKILSTSFDMLLPAYVYPMNASAIKKLHVFSAGTVEYFGRDHAPYATVSIILIAVLVAVPMIILLCYPFAYFRYWLRKLRLDSDALQSFVNHFQESYKNKREDGVEYRWFPLLYFILRVVLLLLYGAALSAFFFPVAGVVLTAFVVLLAVCRPRKSEVHNAIDMFHITWFLIFILGIMANITANSQTKRKGFLQTSVIIISISACLPIFYVLGLIFSFFFFEMGLAGKIKRTICHCVRLPFQSRQNYERLVDYGSCDSVHYIPEADNDKSQIFVPMPNKTTSTTA